MRSTAMRTHMCGELDIASVGKTVSLCGWVARRREHGEHLAFLDIRDAVWADQAAVKAFCMQAKP